MDFTDSLREPLGFGAGKGAPPLGFSTKAMGCFPDRRLISSTFEEELYHKAETGRLKPRVHRQNPLDKGDKGLDFSSVRVGGLRLCSREFYSPLLYHSGAAGIGIIAFLRYIGTQRPP